MQTGIDLKLQRSPQIGNIYDLSLKDGELNLVDNFDTSLQMVVYCERRADGSEVARPELRRGWHGNEFADLVGFEIGSKLWLLKQARLDQTTVNQAIAYAQEGASWYVTQGYLYKVEVNCLIVDNQKGSITLEFKLYRSPNEIETKSFILWNNTESFNERSL